jgi:septal ring factor EnvC (AmiA/AmiB activator)
VGHGRDDRQGGRGARARVKGGIVAQEEGQMQDRSIETLRVEHQDQVDKFYKCWAWARSYLSQMRRAEKSMKQLAKRIKAAEDREAREGARAAKLVLRNKSKQGGGEVGEPTIDLNRIGRDLANGETD